MPCVDKNKAVVINLLEPEAEEFPTQLENISLSSVMGASKRKSQLN